MADNDTKETPETSGARRRRSRGTRDGAAPGRVPPPDPSQLRFFTLIPERLRIDFIGNRRRGMMLSLALVLTSILAMVYNFATTGSALNYGIDFQGGSSVRIALTQPVDIEQMRGILDESGYSGSSAVAVPDAENEVLIRVKEVVSISEPELAVCQDALSQLSSGAKLLPDDGFVHPAESSKIFMKFDAQPIYPEIEKLMREAGCDGTASSGDGKPEEFPVEFALIGVGNEIAKRIDAKLGAGAVDHIVASETVGAKVGDQLKTDGIQAMLIAIMGIFVFVMIRFDLRFAPGGIVALTHDAIVVVGAFALTGKEFNLQTIAALLTVIGYSINDTIVVFDRIRERVALHRDVPIAETTNSSLNETLSRTVLTSLTTLFVVISTWVLGSGPIKDFAFALTVGLVVGTYSSLFVAAPVFLWINDKMYAGKGHLITADKDLERGTGTLLGPQIEGQTGGQPGDEAAADDEAIDVDAKPSRDDDDDDDGDGDGDQGGGADDLGVKISDVDKHVGERKTRRRRRQSKD